MQVHLFGPWLRRGAAAGLLVSISSACLCGGSVHAVDTTNRRHLDAVGTAAMGAFRRCDCSAPLPGHTSPQPMRTMIAASCQPHLIRLMLFACVPQLHSQQFKLTTRAPSSHSCSGIARLPGARSDAASVAGSPGRAASARPHAKQRCRGIPASPALLIDRPAAVPSTAGQAIPSQPPVWQPPLVPPDLP